MDGFRIPKPTREADHYVRDLRRAYQWDKKGDISDISNRA
jgi:hypothetical protein